MTENAPLFDAADASAANQPEYSVGDISRAIKRTLESGFARVRVRGEISGFKRASSGHCYFRLKDDEAVLDAVCWRASAARLAVAPQDGLEVIATGRVSSYPGRSSYQIIVESIEPAGEGALLKLLEDRRRKLAAEGLFDEDRKRKLPFLPDVIGVVTSPTGAVIRDILHRLRDRFPRRVLLWPVAVQGETAAAQVAAAIAGFNALPEGGPVPRPDVLIVARGGGSLEDLWAFNEEEVVRAAAASAIPLIAAVGHETDHTLIDLAADRRAPTPTAAAEMAVPVRTELLATVLDRARRLVGCMDRLFEDRRARLQGLARGLPDPEGLLETAAQRLDERAERLGLGIVNLMQRQGGRVAEAGGRLRHPRELIEGRRQALAGIVRALGVESDRTRGFVARKRAALDRLAVDRRLRPTVDRRLEEAALRLRHAGSLLESYSYRGVLERGFALVHHEGTPVTRAEATRPGMAVDIEFADGRVPAVVGGDEAAAPPSGPPVPRSKRRSGPGSGDQGTLL